MIIISIHSIFCVYIFLFSISIFWIWTEKSPKGKKKWFLPNQIFPTHKYNKLDLKSDKSIFQPTQIKIMTKNMILVSDSIYDLLQTKIMQTPYKKRKNFKFYLTDKWGVRSKVVYKNEKLYNWSLIHKDWCEITSPSSEPGFERFEPCSALGASICALHKIKQTNPEIDTDYYHDQCMKKIQDQNHTGNHYRQQYITERKSQPIYG